MRSRESHASGAKGQTVTPGSSHVSSGSPGFLKIGSETRLPPFGLDKPRHIENRISRASHG